MFEQFDFCYPVTLQDHTALAHSSQTQTLYLFKWMCDMSHAK